MKPALSIFSAILLVLPGCSKDESATSLSNRPPVVDHVIIAPSPVTPGDTALAYVLCHDDYGDSLAYEWDCVSGSFVGSNIDSSVLWVSPYCAYIDTLSVAVSDGRETVTTRSTAIVGINAGRAG